MFPLLPPSGAVEKGPLDIEIQLTLKIQRSGDKVGCLYIFY